MNLASLSIKRPIFISCIVILMLVVGYISMKKLAVDLFPDVTFPIVMVRTPYPGVAPAEMETLVSKPLEDEIGTISGIKTLRSVNKEGLSTVVAEFTLETDIKYAEQQVRDRVASAKRKLPDAIDEPIIRRIDPADQPVVILAITGDIPEAKLFDFANEVVRPKLEQVSRVGLVEILGGRKREIQVQLDRSKLKAYEVSATQVAQRIANAGQNVPIGKVDDPDKETILRAVAEFGAVKDIETTVVNFLGNDVPVTVKDIGQVHDTLEDEKSRTFVNGQKSILLMVFRQSGANTVAVVDAVKKRSEDLNKELASYPGKPALSVVRDTSKAIRLNLEDVKESIGAGICLTILVVFLFLGNGRSTIITGLALPNSLLGAFILMSMAGFSINVMTLLALSLSVGLLVDDAIVVRENIFRHQEMGKTASRASLEGTQEVTLAVIATTFTILAVFGPIGFLKGVVGQFFRQFGLTICFAMMISLFDALTVAPMLSAYFAARAHKVQPGKLWNYTLGFAAKTFGRFQDFLEEAYSHVLVKTQKQPILVLMGALGIFIASIFIITKVPKTFLPAQDIGEFAIGLDLPPGTSLEKMAAVAAEVDGVLRGNKEIVTSVLIIGDRDGEANTAQIFAEMVPTKQRTMNTSQFKERMRGLLKPFAYANPKVKDIDMVMGGVRPFSLNISGSDEEKLIAISQEALAKLKDHPALKDVDISYRVGKPEFQVVPENRRATVLGISTMQLGQELRAQIEGVIAAQYREQGREYDIRVRLADDQRDLKKAFHQTYVPNVNNALIRLSDVAKAVETTGPATIDRQDRGRYIQINADMAPSGPGMGQAMADVAKLFSTELKLPPGFRYSYVGQAENFKELSESMAMAAFLGILFIYLVLASLYESFVIPFTIMLTLPLAVCGAFIALFVTGKSFDLFSMIGCIMLLGIATKNSILLVDYANQLVAEGVDRATAITRAGKTRLRPILMTTVALIAGMSPVAIGLNEASRQRTSMGVAIIGGLISSTVLTLLVVPAVYAYLDRFRIWSAGKVKALFGTQGRQPSTNGPAGGEAHLSH